MTCIDLKSIFVMDKTIQVPCGKCLPCLTNKRSDWSFRLEQEHKHSKSAHFVTLTYDEKHKPSDGSLNKRHLQLFFKRLRKKDEASRIRYYAVGEYGSKTGRPHYHILLFNSVEEHIRKAWLDENGKTVGIVHIGKIEPASVAYVTKYVVQKSDYPHGKLKPFATMSRAYGIGARYLSDAMVEYHRTNEANYITRPGNIKGRLPRFYREKIWPNIKLPENPSRFIRNIKAWHDQTREKISSASMKLTLTNQERERNWYKKKFPTSWESVMLEERNAVLSRIKQKLVFTQTF